MLHCSTFSKFVTLVSMDKKNNVYEQLLLIQNIKRNSLSLRSQMFLEYNNTNKIVFRLVHYLFFVISFVLFTYNFEIRLH